MIRLTSFLPRRLKPWLWQRLSRLMHLNYRLPSGISTHISSYSDWCIYNDIFVAGEYDRAILAALDRARPGETFRVVDLGANAGFFTLRVLDWIARRQLPFTRIECLLVEASPRLRATLHGHLDSIGWKELSAKIVIGLVGRRTGEGRLVLQTSECMNQVVDEPSSTSCRVPYYDLDEALAGISEINVLKCDIEGSEREFLENYTPILRRCAVAVFEFHDPLCPSAVGVPKVMAAGFASNHVLLDQGNATTVLFER